MKNHKNAPQRPLARSTGNSAVLTGILGLSFGLILGFYAGQRSVPAGHAHPPDSPAAGASANPANLFRDEAALQALIGVNPSDRSVLVKLGNLYYDSGRFREAVDTYGRALDLDPKDVNVRTDRGTSYWNLGQADAAIAEFEKSLGVDPRHAQTLFNLGVVYHSGKNDPDSARGAWERLLATNPTYPERARVESQLAALPPAATEAPGARDMEALLAKMRSGRP